MNFRKLVCLAGAAAMLLAAGQVAARDKKEGKTMRSVKANKVLVVYFSHSGNTRVLAEQIHELAGGDIFELVPAAPYPAEYDAVVEQAKRELQAEFKPKLKGLPDLKSYDVVFIGSPNWWNTFAGPVRTFLSGNDLGGKTVVPFITHGGSGLGRMPADVARLCPKAKVAEGLAVWGNDVKNARGDVAAWLRRIKLLK